MKRIATPRYPGTPEGPCEEGPREIVPRDNAQTALVPQDMHPGSDDMIRKMMAQQRREDNRRRLPEIMPGSAGDTGREPHAAFSTCAKRRMAWGKAVRDMPEGHFHVVEHEEEGLPRPGPVARLLRRRPGRGKAARKSPLRRWHVILAVLGLTLGLQPMLIPGLVTGLFWVIIAASLVFGPGRVADFIHGSWLWVLRCNPTLAAGVRKTGGALARWRAAAPKRLSGHQDGKDRDDPFETGFQAGVFRG